MRMHYEAKDASVARQSDITISVRFFEQGGVNKIGHQVVVEMPNMLARRLVSEIQELVPEVQNPGTSNQ